MSIELKGSRNPLLSTGVKLISDEEREPAVLVSHEKKWNMKPLEGYRTLGNYFSESNVHEAETTKTSDQEEVLVIKNCNALDSDTFYTYKINSLKELLSVMETDGIDGIDVIDGIDFDAAHKSVNSSPEKVSFAKVSQAELRESLRELNAHISHDKQLCFGYKMLSDVDAGDVHCILGISESREVEYCVKKSHVIYSSSVKRDKFYPIVRIIVDSFAIGDNQ